MKINVEVSTTKHDYIRFQKRHSYKYIWVYAMLALLTILLGVLILTQKQKSGQINSISVALFIVAAGIFIYMVASSVVKIIKIAKQDDKKPIFNYTFTKGAVHCESEGRSFDLPWTKVYSVAEAKDMFLVYVNKESAFIIPKRCFKNDNDIAEFRDNLLFEPRKIEKVKPKKPLL